jgi:hypothetical protein
MYAEYELKPLHDWFYIIDFISLIATVHINFINIIKKIWKLIGQNQST